MLTASLAPLGQNPLPEFIGFSTFEPARAVGPSADAIRVLSIAPATRMPVAPPARARKDRRPLCSGELGARPMNSSPFFFTGFSMPCKALPVETLRIEHRFKVKLPRGAGAKREVKKRIAVARCQNRFRFLYRD